MNVNRSGRLRGVVWGPLGSGVPRPCPTDFLVEADRR